MPEVWANYVEQFRHHDPDFLGRPEVVGLAARLRRLAPWVSRQLSVGPRERFATLAHGDYKAMLDRSGGLGGYDSDWAASRLER